MVLSAVFDLVRDYSAVPYVKRSGPVISEGRVCAGRGPLACSGVYSARRSQPLLHR